MKVQRTAHGLRDAMFDVLDDLREGNISARQAKVQMEAAKAVCMTIEYERQELAVVRDQIELDERLKVIEGARNAKAIEHHH